MSSILNLEENLIVKLSRSNLSEKQTAEVDKIINDNLLSVNWESLIEKADIAQTSQLVYYNLKRFKNIPEQVIIRLSQRYYNTIKNNIISFQEIDNLVNSLTEKNIPVIVLKGVFAAEHIFKNIGLYQGSDIDILVPFSKLDDTKEVFNELGYRQAEGLNETDYIKGHHHLPPYIKGDFTVEIHWRLSRRYDNIDPDFWWNNIQETTINNKKYLVLSPESYIIYAICRLYSHGFYPLRFIVFLAEMIKYYQPELRWDRLLNYARMYKIDRRVLFSLNLVSDLLEVEMPEMPGDKVIWGYRYLKNRVLKTLFKREIIHTRNMIYYLILQNSISEGLAAGLKRIVSPEEIRIRYRLPQDSKKIYLYYLLNPYFLLRGRRKTPR